MASIAQFLPTSSGGPTWIWQWLRNELAPYPGRVALVARMIAAATLVMVIGITCRVPSTAYGAIFALMLSRESLRATADEVRMVVIGLIGAGAYVLIGAMLVQGDPNLRLVWVIGSFFLIFYGMAAASNSAVAVWFGYLIVITIPLWDRPISAETKVTNTLWAIGTITIASLITLLLEIAVRRGNDLMAGITERLAYVEELLCCYADDRPIESSIETGITRLALVGTSRLRRMLSQSNVSPYGVQEMGAVVALTGRLIDLTANLAQFTRSSSEADRGRIAKIAAQIAEIRADLAKGLAPNVGESDLEPKEWPKFPLLGEIERTVLLIRQSFSSSERLKIFAPAASDQENRRGRFSAGTLFDREHIKFGLRGCLAASVCYLTYNILFWPEIASAVTTCFLTALTTVGSSRQKQALRFGGALIGAVLGLGAQIFVLPSIDSIAGFTVLFILVAAFAAWIATSSPRLSYLGVQVFIAFALINLQEFKFQTSLTVGRDRVLGTLFGLFVMWACFDHLWSTPAGAEMRVAFTSSLRLLARLARQPFSKDLRTAIETSYELREKIDAGFQKTRSLADGVLFEFGSSRNVDLNFRDIVRRWQPQLNALFLMRIASLKYRLQAPGFETPESIRVLQAAYDSDSADLLERMADQLADGDHKFKCGYFGPSDSLKRTLDEIEKEAPLVFPPSRAESFISLLRGIDRLTSSLVADVAAHRAAPD
jgi:multidrug resistance protein MdtO